MKKMPLNGMKVQDSGAICWYVDGKLHRSDGPAVKYPDGKQFWWLNGRLHRTDGPAAEYIDGRKYWYIDGLQIDCETQEEFERLLRLKAFW